MKVDYNTKYYVEKSKDGRNIININLEGKSLYIGSKYSVQRDIEFLKNKISELNEETLLVVFGLGTGEHILELLNITSSNNKILIVEPDKNILEIFQRLSYKNIIKNDKRVLILNKDENNLNDSIDQYININNMNNVEILDFANYNKIYGEEYSQLAKLIRDRVNSLIFGLNTSIAFAEQYFTCFIENVSAIAKSTFINNFKNSFENKPAIVVSAGPSLQKNIGLLKECHENFLIITGGRTLKSVLDIDVNPDFVCVLDPGEPSYKVMEDSLDREIPMVFNELSNHKVVDKYKGKKIFFSDLLMKEVTEKVIGKRVDGLYQGGSVAHICTSFAGYLGCNPIIFIGQDFAYTNNKYHADAATKDIDRNLNLVEYNKNEISTEDINGEQVLTSKVFLFYKELLEKFIQENPQVKFINSTEGGANIIGTEVKSLKETISNYKDIIDKDIKDLLNRENSLYMENLKINLQKSVEDLKTIEEKSKAAVEYSSKIIEHYTGKKQHNINVINRELSKIDEYINLNVDKTYVIKTLLTPEILKVTMDLKYKGKIKETELEKGERLAVKTNKLYEGILKTVQKAIPSIEKALSKLQSLN